MPRRVVRLCGVIRCVQAVITSLFGTRAKGTLEYFDLTKGSCVVSRDASELQVNVKGQRVPGDSLLKLET